VVLSTISTCAPARRGPSPPTPVSAAAAALGGVAESAATGDASDPMISLAALLERP